MTYIVIEGVIGVGKTALTRVLGEQFGVQTLFEKFEENPFLNNLPQHKTLDLLFACHSPESCAWMQPSWRTEPSVVVKRFTPR